MVRNGEHLQAVRQRPQLVRRKGDVPRRERRRRLLTRPFLESGESGSKPDEQHDRHDRAKPHAVHCRDPPGSTAVPGITVSSIRDSAVKYVWATRCTSASVTFWKRSNS